LPKTIRERLAVVETELKNLQGDIQHFSESLHDFKKFVYTRLDNLADHLVDVETHLRTIDTRLDSLNPRLTGRDKAAIIAALITSLSSITVVLIQVIG